MRVVLWMLAALSAPTASGGHEQGAAAVQIRAEAPEEIVVRGRRLSEFRVEVQLARERAYAIFNEINSTDDFDIHCNDEQRTGTRMGRDVCVARFEGRISRRAAQSYLAGIKDRCGGQVKQDCMFDPNIAGFGLASAQAVEGEGAETARAADSGNPSSRAHGSQVRPGDSRLLRRQCAVRGRAHAPARAAARTLGSPCA